MKAILDSACGEEINEEDLPFNAQLLYPVIQSSIDRMRTMSEQKSAAGKQGGRPKKAELSEEKSSAFETEKAVLSKNEKPEPNHTEPIYTEPIEKREAPTVPREKAKPRFDEAWEAYPKKQGRKEAEIAYLRAIKSGVKHEDIMAGIEAYKAYLAREKIQEQYIKQGSTFFKQAAWADDYEPHKKRFGRDRIDYDKELLDLFVQQIKNEEATG